MKGSILLGLGRLHITLIRLRNLLSKLGSWTRHDSGRQSQSLWARSFKRFNDSVPQSMRQRKPSDQVNQRTLQRPSVGAHPLQSMSASQERLPEGNITTPMTTGECSPGRFSKAIDTKTRLDDLDYQRPSSTTKPSLYQPSNDRVSPRNQHGRFNQRPYEYSNERLSPPRGHQPPEPGGWGTRPEDRRAHSDTQHDDPYSERPEQHFRLAADQKKTSYLPSSIDDGPEALDVLPEMLLQPETRPISHDQLVIEVKGIYAGLVMVEAKCIDIDEKQSTAARKRILLEKLDLRMININL